MPTKTRAQRRKEKKQAVQVAKEVVKMEGSQRTDRKRAGSLRRSSKLAAGPYRKAENLLRRKNGDKLASVKKLVIQEMKTARAGAQTALTPYQQKILQSLTLPGHFAPTRIMLPSEVPRETNTFRYTQEGVLDLMDYRDHTSDYGDQIGNLTAIQGFVVNFFHDPNYPLMWYRRTGEGVSINWTCDAFAHELDGSGNVIIGKGNASGSSPNLDLTDFKVRGMIFGASSQNNRPVSMCHGNSFFFARPTETIGIKHNGFSNVATALYSIELVKLGTNEVEENNDLVVASKQFSSTGAQNFTYVIPSGVTDVAYYAWRINFQETTATLAVNPMTIVQLQLTILTPATTWYPHYYITATGDDLTANAQAMRLWGNSVLMSPETPNVWVGGKVRAFDLTMIDSPWTVATASPESIDRRSKCDPWDWNKGIYGWTRTRDAPILANYAPDIRGTLSASSDTNFANYAKIPVAAHLPSRFSGLPYGYQRYVITQTAFNTTAATPLPVLVVTAASGEFLSPSQLWMPREAPRDALYSAVEWDMAHIEKWTENPLHIKDIVASIRRFAGKAGRSLAVGARFASLLGIPYAAQAQTLGEAVSAFDDTQ